MRLRILAIGRQKDASCSALIADYRKRLRLSLEIEEIESKKADSAESRKANEANALRNAYGKPPAGGRAIIALDERGLAWSSAEFAKALGDFQDRGTSEIIFIIGGADGLSPAILSEANLSLSLGRMTWPHALARVLLVEQIYRAEQILSGHPYHRA